MKLKFLGTNGWFTSKTGNTPCLAIFAKDRLIVFDAGNGFSRIKKECERAGMRKVDVFLSHLHLDHVEGLHTLPLLPKGVEVRVFFPPVYGKTLAFFINHPFTAPASLLNAKLKLVPLKKRPTGLPYKISFLPLDHADPCLGYRLEIEGKTIAYCTDTGPCRNMERLADGADLLISECTLLPGAKIYPKWPHLTPEAAANAAKKSGAKKLVLTHFDANNYPTAALRKKAEKAARRTFKNSFAANDGLAVDI